jgi:predicted enzyme related to lactoylglutathione lyase
MDMGPTGVYLIFGQNGVQRGGMYNPSAVTQMPPSWMPYAAVPDADKAYALATSIGSTSLVPPMDVPGGGRIACLLDPAGAAFSVHSMPATVAAPAAKPKPKAKSKPKAKAAAKPAAKKPVVKKAAPKKKAAKKAASKKKAPARKVKSRPKVKAKAKAKAKAKKKSGARRKK